MIYVANDHAGYLLGMAIFDRALYEELDVFHLGCASTRPTDYPLFAKRVAEALRHDPVHERGILVCKTGIGMSIAANRHSHVRAALCATPSQARLCREHNGANVLCLGAHLTIDDAWPIVQLFLNTEVSEDERHVRRRAALD